jgi:hypothetical protein
MKKQLFFLLTILLMAALACGTGDDPTPEPTEAVVATDTPVQADLPTETPAGAVSPAPVFTVTPAVTDTPLPTATSTSTPTATATSTPALPNATQAPPTLPPEIQTLVPTFPPLPTIEGFPTLPPLPTFGAAIHN